MTKATTLRIRDALRMISDSDIEELIAEIKDPLYRSLENEKVDASDVAIKIRHTTTLRNKLLTIKRI